MSDSIITGINFEIIINFENKIASQCKQKELDRGLSHKIIPLYIVSLQLGKLLLQSNIRFQNKKL